MNKAMRILLWIVLGSLLLTTGCQSSDKKEQADITRLEASVEKSPEPETARQLIDRYTAYAGQHPGDDERNSKYLYRAAALAYRMNRYSQAIELLERAIREDFPGSNTLNNILLLGAVYDEKLRNDAISQTLYQAAGRAFPNSEALQKKTKSEWSPLDDHLRQLQQGVFDSVGNRIDFRIANDFIQSATLYAMLLPGDPQSAEWLFSAAETARSIRAFNKALELYAWIYERFPDHSRAPESLFLQAFTLDNDLNRYDEAGKLYRDFLDKYPDDSFAKDARFLLENLGKDEEEIIRSFEEKNKSTNS